MKEVIVYQIDAFTKSCFKGNPAGVVINADGLTDSQMQMIAREMNNSETAFLLSAEDSSHDGIIRYFTPTVEVPTCGHATIAAMYAKATEESLQSCRLNYKTQIGILPFEIIKSNDDYKITMTQGAFSIEDSLDAETQTDIVAALGLKQADLNPDCPIQIASTGHSKVLVGIRENAVLHALNPDLFALKNLSQQIACNGFYVFTFNPTEEILVHGRMFAPAIGIAEDPVTGNANGPLGGYLVYHQLVETNRENFKFTASQGEKMGRQGHIEVKVSIKENLPDVIQVCGEAVVVFRTSISI